MDGKCYDICDPFGGVLSIVGALSGQCDCGLKYNTTDLTQPPICVSDEVTCCGDLDNGGGVVLFVIVIFFTFLGLAIICDEYFCESLDAISTALNLSDDVAGATFMAAGSSAPELFTAIVTTLITGGNEGLGTIAGSAIFNIMVIVGVTALFAGQTLGVWWYPLSRDSIVYLISILAMTAVMWNYKIETYEAAILVCMYGGYIYLMVRNADLSEWARKRDRKIKPGTDKATAAAAAAVLGGGKSSNAVPSAAAQTPNSPARSMNPMLMPAYRHALSPVAAARRDELRKDIQISLDTAMKVNKASNLFLAKIGKKSMMNNAHRLSRIMQAGTDLGAEDLALNSESSASPSPNTGEEAKRGEPQADAGTGAAAGGGAEAAEAGGPATEKLQVEAGAEDEEEDDGMLSRVINVLSVPLVLLFKYTVPDCRKEEKQHLYMATFGMSIFWIGVLSFIMVDFAARAGCVIGVPGLLMGQVVIAAGTSVPDALSSILVAKNGQGDMAVANVLGSNIFNIFLGLGLPWLLKSLIDGKPVELDDNEPLIASVLVLVVYLALFMGIIIMANWKLSRQVAYYFFVAHIVFLGWNLLTGLEDPLINTKF